MDRFTRLMQRRQFLLYLGLGVTGASIALIAKRNFGEKGFDDLQENSTQTSTSSGSSPAQNSIAATSSEQTLPEFQDIAQWLNSDPVSISALKGNVVLIQIWTFACINCQRTLPYMRRWHQQYGSKGLKIIGIHTPEFAFERDISAIKSALEKHQIRYPVAIDNDYTMWKAYQNEYWPHLFLADRQGVVRYDHIGEGAYAETEQTIRRLLG